jgi:flagellar assembly factor FliW
MKINTACFGTTEVYSQDIIRFPKGIFGFPECTKYSLIKKIGLFRIMQSLEKPSHAFISVVPTTFYPDYVFTLIKDDLERVKTHDVNKLSVYCIVNMARDIRDASINLQCPLIINPKCNIGHQFVSLDYNHKIRSELIQNASQLIDLDKKIILA